jgi:sulfhydrogenase subunit beta (sulfur reductase)
MALHGLSLFLVERRMQSVNADGNEAAASPRTLPAERLDDLVAALRGRGYRVVAPVLREGAVSYGEIASASELPRGWTDRQEAGTYRLERDPRDLYFGFTLGAQSWKPYLFPPRLRLWTAERSQDGFEVSEELEAPPQQAFLGVRPCDLAAIAVQDRVFLGGRHQDPDYRRRRERALLVAVTCTQAAATCFCTSMGHGPRAEAGFDLALTELRDKAGHRFLVEAGSTRGAEILAELPTRAAAPADQKRAERVAATTAAQITRRMPAGIAGVLRHSYIHPRWDEVAQRCLACTNCTLVCPTCFCMAVEDTTDLTGVANRDRRWDSCFTSEHSYIHGGSVHASTASRYRQWMTHKLSTWFDQFGTSGCVGCGRCIAWCPAAIDITEEAAAITAAQGDGTC